MESAEDPVAIAERHVREGEARIARQERIIEEMARDDHPEAEQMGMVVLKQFRRTLELMREHLETLRLGSRPPPPR
jgi:hypothetical protein